jgi:hypothetical protein
MLVANEIEVWLKFRRAWSRLIKGHIAITAASKAPVKSFRNVIALQEKSCIKVNITVMPSKLLGQVVSNMSNLMV